MQEPSTPLHTKMEKLNFEAGLHRGLKDVQDGTKLPYPTLINCNRGYQVIKGKICKYTPSRGTKKILMDFYVKPWEDIFEDRSKVASEEEIAKESQSSKKAINEAFIITSENGKRKKKHK